MSTITVSNYASPLPWFPQHGDHNKLYACHTANILFWKVFTDMGHVRISLVLCDVSF